MGTPDLNALLERLEIAIRHGQVEVALGLVAGVRGGVDRLAGIAAAVDIAFVVMGEERSLSGLNRFVNTIAASLDHDAHQ